MSVFKHGCLLDVNMAAHVNALMVVTVVPP